MSVVVDWTPPGRSWTRPAEAVAAALHTDPRRGLDAAEAARRLRVAGTNELVEEPPRTVLATFAAQFANTMTAVLVVAGVVTLVVGDWADTAVIGVIVVMNAVIGLVQEHRAERAMAALKRISAPTARVLRDGDLGTVAVRELVPGDVVPLGTGDVVPADLRLVESHGLRVDEAALTGESEPVAKIAEPLPSDDVPVAERLNMAFRGTAVTHGRATGIVVASGMETEIGQIAALLQAHAAGATPLQHRLARLGRRLAAAALGVCLAVFAAGVAGGEAVDEMFLRAVSLAVAAIPEGLPAVVTIALALGARRMADRNALVRRLPAVEALGSVDVVCADKTGTLTANRMVVERVWTPAGSYRVSGDGYAPAGSVTDGAEAARDPYLPRLARVAAACNDARLHAHRDTESEWTITGDPTEAALLALAGKLDVEPAALAGRHPRRAEITFDARRRRMVTVHGADGGCWVAVKGALDALVPLLAAGDRPAVARAEDAAARLADDGYRVLALAERRTPALPEQLARREHDLHLVGLVGIADPPRPRAAAALATCRAAGIRAVMITGDHPRTARAIGQRLGLLAGGELLTGADLDALDATALVERVAGVQVYARTSPEQKLRIVEAWKARGAVVAMTGDGVNDAPALRRADVGVAMGIAGTDVSREAADIVLADDDFATIVQAVEEGRRIYDNIRRFVRYLLATNSGELLVMLLAPLAGLPFPLLAIQILWINLVTDGLPAVALGLEPAEPRTMRRPPRPRGESILGAGLWQHALGVGLLMAAVTLGVQALALAREWPWRTMVFTTLAFLQLGNALAVRSETQSLLALGLATNPWLGWAVFTGVAAQLAVVYVPGLRVAFACQPLSGVQLAVVVVASTAAGLAVELRKWRRRREGIGRRLDLR